ncbi:hypothetical protein FOC52_14150 (plasmid) [Staphylococcus cohnii]|nr:hypothetical protein FOC52_14150 [Staphylococcus cohnii]
MIELEKEYGAFYALSEIFTLNQINALIELYNDFVEHPEKYEKRKKSKGIDMEDQEKIVNKHLSDMNSIIQKIIIEKKNPAREFKR